MPTQSKRACSTPGCQGYTRYRGKCPACTTKCNVSRGTATERGYDAAWRRLRYLVLLDEPLCRECYQTHRYTPATDVDHIIPISRAPQRRLDRTNLQSLCHACHSRKTATEGGLGLL